MHNVCNSELTSRSVQYQYKISIKKNPNKRVKNLTSYSMADSRHDCSRFVCCFRQCGDFVIIRKVKHRSMSPRIKYHLVIAVQR